MAKTAQTKEELDFKSKHNLGDHVRVALGTRPKRIVPVKTGQNIEPPRGLGDRIAAFTRKMGIKQCAGCRRRQVALNRVFPNRRARR